MKTSEYINTTSKEYSIYTCKSRAIPSVTDGLKDGQRKALWLMRNNVEKIKVVSLSGSLIASNLYLHGDASASEAISKMAGPFINNLPLLKGVGAFGTKINPTAMGAPRYVYVKKNPKAAQIMFSDLNIVPMQDNYDGSVKEPVTFLPIIPTVLLNGISGVAVGWSTDILPRSLEDLKKATIQAIEGKTVDRLVPKYEYLDCVGELIEDNSWSFSGNIKVIDSSTLNVIGLPPELTLEKFREHLDKLEEAGEIKSYDDNSRNEIDVTIKVKRGSLDGVDDKKLIDKFKLKTKQTERIVVLDWSGKTIKQYETAEEVVKNFVEWRFNHYVNRYETQKIERQTDLNFTMALIDCFDKGLPNDVLKLKNRAEIESKVVEYTKQWNITDAQIDRIVSLPIYRWSKEAYNKLLEEKKSLEKELAYVIDLLANPKKIKKIFKTEVEAI